MTKRYPARGPLFGPPYGPHNWVMRARVLLVTMAMIVAAAVALEGPAVAERRTPEVGATVSPSGSPSPGARPGDRRAPGFAVLLILLGLALLWQFQRARRTTDR